MHVLGFQADCMEKETHAFFPAVLAESIAETLDLLCCCVGYTEGALLSSATCVEMQAVVECSWKLLRELCKLIYKAVFTIAFRLQCSFV